MTMLLSLPMTAESAVFSGDRRLTDAKGVTDNNQKATQLGTNGIGGATGRTRVLHKETQEIQRDAHAWMREFFHGHAVSQDSIEQYCQYLRQRYQHFLEIYKEGKEQDNVDCCLFTSIIVYLSGPLLLTTAVKAHVTTHGGLIAKPYTSRIKNSFLMPQGDAIITDELTSLCSPPLKRIYDQVDIRSLLNPNPGLPFGMISEDRAVEICRFVNQECSEKAPDLTGEASTISPDCDVLVLDRNGVRKV